MVKAENMWFGTTSSHCQNPELQPGKCSTGSVCGAIPLSFAGKFLFQTGAVGFRLEIRHVGMVPPVSEPRAVTQTVVTPHHHHPLQVLPQPTPSPTKETVNLGGN